MNNLPLLGEPLPDWKPANLPPREVLQGRYCRLEPLETAHATALWDAFSLSDAALWDYLPYGPFENFEEFAVWLELHTSRTDTIFFAICDVETKAAIGLSAYLRIDLDNGSIEVGHLAFSPRLQRTRAATEAMFLMARHAFALGFRRYEWKCNALNEPSRRAALRLGFVYEGTFRQAAIVKGRNRDTAWFSMLDGEWPLHERAFENWLARANFDEEGQQKQSLAQCRNSFETPLS